MSHHDEVATIMAENGRLKEALKAAGGRVMNAKIDLQTGRTKAQACDTLEGCLRAIEEALKQPAHTG